MKIKQVIKTPEGNFTFEGDLSPEEHDFVVEAGINYLLKEGVIPFKIMKDDKASYVTPEEATPQ